MTFQFRPAVRENVGVIVGLAGGTGSGKTYSAMRLAKGIAGDKKFAVIDTENRRALHYADQFQFDYAELHEPFNPERYADAIAAADEAGYPVIVVDSMSHSWAGTGGVLDMQEAEFERLGSREATKMLSWAKPKAAHKKMVSRLLQVKAHLILCFRAEPKVEMVKKDGKVEVQAKQSLVGLDGWLPICDKSLPFELTVSFLMMAAKPGVGLPIKLQEQHKPMFPAGALIDEDCGRRIAEWAAGGSAVMATVFASFAKLGITRDQLAAKLGHDPTEADVDALRAYKSEVQASRKPKAAPAATPPQRAAQAVGTALADDGEIF